MFPQGHCCQIKKVSCPGAQVYEDARMNLDPFDKKVKNRGAFPALVLGGVGLLALTLAAFFWLVGEMEKPQVALDGESAHIGLS